MRVGVLNDEKSHEEVSRGAGCILGILLIWVLVTWMCSVVKMNVWYDCDCCALGYACCCSIMFTEGKKSRPVSTGALFFLIEFLHFCLCSHPWFCVRLSLCCVCFQRLITTQAFSELTQLSCRYVLIYPLEHFGIIYTWMMASLMAQW